MPTYSVDGYVGYLFIFKNSILLNIVENFPFGEVFWSYYKNATLQKRYPTKTLPYKNAILQERYPTKTLPYKNATLQKRYPIKTLHRLYSLQVYCLFLFVNTI